MPESKWKTRVKADVPDIRDWMYSPPLLQLKETIDPPRDLYILNQKSEGACTGFAVAAAINHLYTQAGQNTRVSPRMLYEMAKRHDEWPGEDYGGSSLRGAIHGWKYMGVCLEKLWRYYIKDKGSLTIGKAKDARSHTIGAYYRLKPEITDYHAALNETGVIAASAKVHTGWYNPKSGRIKQSKSNIGGHAFAIVGYNKEGFWVQNSWGPSWGDNGLALWIYEDWAVNIMDGWVFRLALPTPQIFGLRPGSSTGSEESTGQAKKPAVSRSEIAGHFIHIDDGAYKESGRYWSNQDDIEQTAKLVAGQSKYKHLLVYMHGGLNSPTASARRIAAMKDVFKMNGVYPFHIMYDTGLAEELKDLILRKERAAAERVGAFSDYSDWCIEKLLSRPGTLLWDEMKRDAYDAFAPGGAGTDALERFAAHIRGSGKRIKIHLVGHSTGAVVIAHLLQTMRRRQIRIASCSLMAPACSVDLYNEAYLPVLQGKTRLKLDDLAIYNLRDRLERDDTVTLYKKSLLYLVSNAFEREKGKPILGMAMFKDKVKTVRSLPQFFYSNGTDGQRTRSTTHGGFDNDRYTMNHILRRVLGAAPGRPFTREDLKY